MTVENRVDVLFGFSRQTQLLITGLGGTPDVIEQFRKRNISTEELPFLTEFDLVTLGADYKFISSFLYQMRNTIKSTENFTFQDRFENLIQILKSGRTRIKLLVAFIAFARHRITEKQVNFFVDADKSLRASEAFKIASEAIDKEVDEVKKEKGRLEAFIKATNGVSKKKKYCRFLYVGGLGLAAYALLHLCKKSYVNIH